VAVADDPEGAARDAAIGRAALRKASWRLLPLIGLGYGIAYMDRLNISFAALQMNHDLRFSASVYGLGAGLFFLSYALLEVPSNLMLMRFGARRWMARIMLTWGLIAAGMMLVRTPTQFYVMRFLLGAAEAGFFPGVVFYLMQWFPAAQRGRAISRFYVALPLSSVVMGAIAGLLLDLRGTWGLAGWQWLFAVEGLPAVLLSVAILIFLPDSPARAAWLTADERAWIEGRLAADKAALGPPGEQTLRAALFDPRVWRLGVANLCMLGAFYAFALSAPAVLAGVTHWGPTKVGFLIAVMALLGATAMVTNGWHSDVSGERHWHLAIPMTLAAAAFVVIGTASAPLIVIAAYGLVVICTNAVQAIFYLIPSDVLEGRAAAVGVAAIGSIGMIGAFLGPAAWGMARDHTGSFQAGLLFLPLPCLVTIALVFLVRQAGRGGKPLLPMGEGI
jgi:ACS family tartrate transporter-like MFS transporter